MWCRLLIIKLGGTELARQLVYTINKNGLEAKVAYYKEGEKPMQVNPAFRRYVDTFVAIQDIEDFDRNVVVLPETRGYSHSFNGISWFLSSLFVCSKLINPSQKKVFCRLSMDEMKNTYGKFFSRTLARMEQSAKYGFTFYTYNPYDAEKYGMKLTTQVYRRNWNIVGQSTRCDFYFIGKSKGRRKKLELLRDELVGRGFSVDFRIFGDEPKEFIPFEKNVQLSMESCCIVDVVAKDNNAGQTLRPLEALFLKKKLLTNDASVIYCDFYHPDNIFVFDDDNFDLNGIEDFMKKSFCEIDESIVKKI